MTVVASKSKNAKGLFRVTGKKSKPVAVKDIAGNIIKVESLEREADDFYPTPPEPTRAIIKSEYNRLRDFPILWEPAAGDGAMCEELKRAGFEIHASDLIDRGYGAELQSFYDFKTAPSKAILTNPPFKDCNADKGWIRHALEDLNIEYMALLLPMNWAGSAKERGKLWADHTPSRIYMMRWRIDFTGQGAPPMLNAWFVWDKNHTGPIIFDVLDKDADYCQSTIFEALEAAE